MRVDLCNPGEITPRGRRNLWIICGVGKSWFPRASRHGFRRGTAERTWLTVRSWSLELGVTGPKPEAQAWPGLAGDCLLLLRCLVSLEHMRNPGGPPASMIRPRQECSYADLLCSIRSRCAKGSCHGHYRSWYADLRSSIEWKASRRNLKVVILFSVRERLSSIPICEIAGKAHQNFASPLFPMRLDRPIAPSKIPPPRTSWCTQSLPSLSRLHCL